MRRPSGGADPSQAAAVLHPRTAFQKAGTVTVLDAGVAERGELAIAAHGDGWLVVTREVVDIADITVMHFRKTADKTPQTDSRS